MNKTCHLFYVTNYIALNNYLSVIKTNDININNCFFYSPRFDEIDFNLNVKLNFIDQHKFYSIKNKIKFFFNAKGRQFLKNINEELSYNKYYLYIPHLFNIRERILLKNKFCVKYFFIEEGLTSYRLDFDRINNIDWGKASTKKKETYINLLKCQPLTIYNNKYGGCYANNIESFKRFPKKSIFPLIFNHTQKKKNNFSKYDNSHIIAIDSPWGWSDFNNYLFAIKSLVNYLKNNKTEFVYIKFHPDCNEKNIDQIQSLFFESKIKIELIPKNIYVEEVASFKIKFKLYNLKSALILYAGFYDISIFIFDSSLKSNDAFYNNQKRILEKAISDLDFKITHI